ncbi:MAG: glycoside hydrolase family 2 TIM barrel-domain containing protein, partial [Brevundimonas sp.]
IYTVSLEAAGDRWSDRVGFRTIETRGREILLNGRPRFLKGIAMHEERLGAEGGRIRTEAEARALLTEVKALGCDFVRLAHYPHGEATLRLADEMGLIVWSEIPVYWEDVAYTSSATLSLGRQMMSEMILRDRNRCSVGFWSVANETPQTPERLAFLRTIIEDVRRLDPTRLVTAALNKNVDVGGVRDGETRLVVADELGRDLVSWP